MDLDRMKGQARQAVQRLDHQLRELSLKIHSNPELGYQEVMASGWLGDFLEMHGFRVERGLAGIATAFRAEIGSVGGPTIAILAEYDALPEIGHACGHNVIACSAVGAGAALAAIKETLPAGRVVVMGTPAEEGGGGKIHLLNQGTFKDVDAAMMIHPMGRTRIYEKLLGRVKVTVEFFGKSAHAAAYPYEGRNALDAVIAHFNALAVLRQQLRPDVRLHGVITKGGEVPNVIPEHTAALFYIRSLDRTYLRGVVAKFEACAQGAAQATGCRAEVTVDELVYEPMRRNQTLSGLFRANLEALGIAEDPPEPQTALGSSDVGNVSQVVPTIQPLIAICRPGTPIHTHAFREAAGTPEAHRQMLAAAATMAMTTLDLLVQPQLLDTAKEEFARTT